MKYLVAVLVLAGLCAGLPQQYLRQYPTQKPIAILRMSQDVNYDGTYNYEYETENGIAVQSKGLVRNRGTKEETQLASGSYTYVSPEGKRFTTNWYADDTGFHAEGEHLPKPPVVRIFSPSL